MRKNLFIITFLCGFLQTFAQNVITSDTKILAIKVNDNAVERWDIDPSINPDIIEIECTQKKNIVYVSDGKNTLKYTLKKGQKINFKVQGSEQTAHLQLMGVEPNVRFTKKYIQQHKGKTLVQIPEVYELVNVIMALHKYASRDKNMFDTQSEYYQRVKAHFEPFRNHPAIDTIEKYITQPRLNREQNVYVFPMESYNYYYKLKLNSAGYAFDKKGRIKNQGFIKEVGQSWYAPFDPMKDVAVFEDFAKKSNFRKFYSKNKPYYDQLLADYARLSPVGKMQQWLDKKFGFGYDSYIIHFSPLNKGAQAAMQFEKDNFKQTFMFVSKVTDDENHTPTMNELLASWIVFTEIDHNYVNPTSNHFLEQINASFSNREKWAVGEVTAAYPDPYAVFNEYMTFALFTMYANDHFSQEDVENFLPMFEQMMQRTRGFIRFRDFNRALWAKYQQNTNASMTDLYTFILNWAAEVN